MDLHWEYNDHKYHIDYDIKRYRDGKNREVEEHILRYRNKTFKGKNIEQVVEKLKQIMPKMPNSEFFCNLTTLEYCGYHNKQECPKTCNLAKIGA